MSTDDKLKVRALDPGEFAQVTKLSDGFRELAEQRGLPPYLAVHAAMYLIGSTFAANDYYGSISNGYGDLDHGGELLHVVVTVAKVKLEQEPEPKGNPQ